MTRFLRNLTSGLAAFALGLGLACSAVAWPFRIIHQSTKNTVYPSYVSTIDTAHGDQLMHRVWNLYKTSGSRIPRGQLTSISTISRPAGISAPTSGAVLVTATSSISGVDFGSNAVLVYNSGTALTVTDGWISSLGGTTHILRGGFNAGGVAVGPATFDLEHVTVDLTGGGKAAIASIDGGTATINYGRILNAPRDPIVFSGGTLTITNTLVAGAATNTNPSDHNEMVYLIDGGTLNLSYSIVDLSYGNSPFTGGWTGLVFLRAQTGNITATIDHTILRGESTIKAPWTIQSKAVRGNVALTVSNSLLEIGSSGFNAALAFDCHTVTTTDGGGNYTTAGSPISVTGFTQAPGLSGTPPTTGTVGVVYSFTPTLGCAPVPSTGLKYSVLTGTGKGPLPPGLSINAGTGVVSGTPTTIGVYPNIYLFAGTSSGNSSTIGPFTITIS